MNDALMELVEPLIQKREQQAARETKSQGISQGIRGFRSLGHSDQEIKRVLMAQYGLTEKDAEKYLRSVK